MSNMFPLSGRATLPPSMPRGEVVARYRTYEEAQKAVDYLADGDFPVQLVSIIGSDLKLVERVMGRLTYPKVALSGALSGAWMGAIMGFLLSLASGSAGQGVLPTAMAVGAGLGMLFAVISHAMTQGKRDFTSMSQVVAGAYEVIVVSEAAADARTRLLKLQQAQPAPAAAGATNAGTTNAAPGGTGSTAAGASPSPAGETAGAQQEQAVPASAPRYKDLPDGRPQFGERLPQGENKAE